MMRLLIALALGISSFAALAQAPSTTPPPEPQVNADRTVTFRLAAPSVAKVSVALDVAAAPYPMEKNEAGVWSVTTPPLAPEWYSYHFVVGSGTLIDPKNVTVKASYVGIGNGFLVPGETPQPWEQTAIAHGTLHHHVYTTKVVLGLDHNQSEYYVYTPPGYDPRGKTKYPVLYLLHGWSDTAAGWASIGHADDILDNLIATGKAKPMIVVMPLGYGDMSFVRSGFGVWNSAEKIDHNVTLFSQAVLTEVLPAVERDYLVSAKREDRAIAGLSMGGLESLTIGLTHTDQFAYVGGFSSAVHQMKPARFAAVDPKKPGLKLLWIGCGTEDDLIEPNRRLTAELKSEGFTVTSYDIPGRHTWLVWRDDLVKFAPLLFHQ